MVDKSALVSAVAAELRRRFQPEATDPNASHRICRGCSALFVTTKRSNHRYCVECAAERLRTAGASIAAKSGSDYERAVLGALAYWRSEAARLGIE